mgnify:CR=1 FL=1
MSNPPSEPLDAEAIKAKLEALKSEHRDLDEVIDRILPIMNDVASVDRPIRINRVGDLGGEVMLGDPPEHPVHVIAGERLDGGHAALVDQPVVVDQRGGTRVGGIRAALRHLLDAEVRPVGEVRMATHQRAMVR